MKLSDSCAKLLCLPLVAFDQGASDQRESSQSEAKQGGSTKTQAPGQWVMVALYLKPFKSGSFISSKFS